MKILQVIQSLKVGGAERVCLDLTQQLMFQGHTVKIALLQDRLEYELTEFKDVAFDIHPLISGQSPIWIKAIRSLSGAFREVYSQGWDIVHCHMDGALAVAALGGARQICYTVHNSVQGHWQGVGLHRVRSLIEWMITRRLDVAIVGCGPGATAWASAHFGWPNKSVRCISNGINLDRFPYLTRVWAPSSPLRVLMVGKLVQQKNYTMAIQAVAQLKQFGLDVSLSIAGEGGLKNVLQERAAFLEISDNVCFLGRRHDVPELHRENDIFWLTSEYEGLPLALLEAMASGLPAIVTNVPGIREIAQSIGIVNIPISDAEALAVTTINLINKKDDVDIERLRLRKSMESNYSSLVMANSYLSIFLKML